MDVDARFRIGDRLSVFAALEVIEPCFFAASGIRVFSNERADYLRRDAVEMPRALLHLSDATFDRNRVLKYPG